MPEGHPGSTGQPPRDVVVAIATFRRNDELRSLLPQVLRETAALDVDARVLVVDNDPDNGAAEVLRSFPEVGHVHERTPGITAARNRALTEAEDAGAVVFIDDDEEPVHGWLGHLVTTWQDARCDAVVGPVVSRFPTPLDPWVEAGGFFTRRRLPTGSVVEVAATNNLLIDQTTRRRLGLTFDDRYGLSGGSDTMFTRQLTRSGGTIVWCDEALVHDVVPTDRMTREWVCRRAYRMANTGSRVDLDLTAGPAQRTVLRGRLLARAGLRVAAGSALVLAGRLTGRTRHAARGSRMLHRGRGMAAGALGSHYHEYGRTS